MEKEIVLSENSFITNEEKELLMLNDRYGRKIASGVDKKMKDESKSIKIDDALKRLYMALILL